MKKLITIASLLLCLTAHAQTKVKKDANGNYVAVSRQDSSANKATGSFFVDKEGNKNPVYISIHGKLFYYRVTKNGNTYKCYLKAE